MIKRAAALNEFMLEEMRKVEKYNMPTDPATQTAELLMDVDTLRMLWKGCGVPKLEEGIVRAPRCIRKWVYLMFTLLQKAEALQTIGD